MIDQNLLNKESFQALLSQTATLREKPEKSKKKLWLILGPLETLQRRM